MQLRAGGLSRIGHFVSKRTHRMDDGACHDDLGTPWMVVGHVRLGSDRAGYDCGERCKKEDGPEHLEFSVSRWVRRRIALRCGRETQWRKAHGRHIKPIPVGMSVTAATIETPKCVPPPRDALTPAPRRGVDLI
ncbi:MAG TPA: hypothetical protein VHM88_01600 [Candidatus Acidoferrales bacterium]|nr:hypothetical protein [Candidatus Acidoferrales bacterium]